MKIIGKIVRSIPGFRQLSNNSMIIAATYYGAAILTMFKYWYWGLALLAVPFLVFYLLDLNDRKRRRLSLAVSIVAGILVLLGTAGGLSAGGDRSAMNLSQHTAPTAKVVASRTPAAKSPMPAEVSTVAALPTDSAPVSTAAASATATAVASPKGQYAYVAAKGSKIFHLPGCASAKRIKAENLIGYQTREEAIAAGLTPCKRCKP